MQLELPGASTTLTQMENRPAYGRGESTSPSSSRAHRLSQLRDLVFRF